MGDIIVVSDVNLAMKTRWMESPKIRRNDGEPCLQGVLHGSVSNLLELNYKAKPVWLARKIRASGIQTSKFTAPTPFVPQRGATNMDGSRHP